MMGMKKQSDFPEPVPVVTTKLCPRSAFEIRLGLMSVQDNRLRIHPKNLCGTWMQKPFSGQIRNAYVSFVVGINGDKGSGQNRPVE